jgi:hypothetical protein
VVRTKLVVSFLVGWYGCAVADVAPVGSATEAQECAQKIGEMPDVDCNKMGSIIPITVEGKEVDDTNYQNITSCDKPHLLDGGCYPFSRLVRVTKGDMEAVVLCRRKGYYAKDYTSYGDVAIIQTNTRTGDTCFFQSFPGTGTIPSPYKKDRTPEEQARADSFWGGTRTWCIGCHDSDPFIHSPFMDGLKGHNALPSVAFSPKPKLLTHSSSYSGGFQTTDRISINLSSYDRKFPPSSEDKRLMDAGLMAPANACTECHFIGTSSYHTFGKMALGKQFSGGQTEWSKQFPHGVWMPPELPEVPDENNPGKTRPLKSKEEYDTYFKRAIEALDFCAANITAAEESLGKTGVEKKFICQDPDTDNNILPTVEATPSSGRPRAVEATH